MIRLSLYSVVIETAFVVLSGLTSVSLADDSTAARIVGTWEGRCIDIGPTPDGRYIRTTSTYKNDGRYEDRTLYYKDSGCRTRSAGIKINKGTYRIVGHTTLADGKKVAKIDYHITFNRYRSMRLPAVRIKNIISISGDTMTMGQISPLSASRRPTRLDPASVFTRR